MLPILVLSPLTLGAKGCNAGVVGDDCAEGLANAVCPSTGGRSGHTGGRQGTGGNTGSGGSTVGTVCGGLRPAGCGPGEFCNYPLAAHCGAADQTGVCESIPEACDAVLKPVCGCDDETYDNACEAALRGVSLSAEGECGGGRVVCGGLLGIGCARGEYCQFAPDAHCGAADQTGLCAPLAEICTEQYAPVCGCDGKTYGNDCFAARAGVSVQAPGECASPSDRPCGGRPPLDCAADEFCRYELGAHCGAADATGTCVTIPKACTQDVVPVCGCNGVTYSNECVAAMAGVSVSASGRCSMSPPGKVCGGLLGLACDQDQYCAYPLEAQCGAADQTGTCATRPEACTAHVDPVCGCDGKTYGNACNAANAGVAVAAMGACK